MSTPLSPPTEKVTTMIIEILSNWPAADGTAVLPGRVLAAALVPPLLAALPS